MMLKDDILALPADVRASKDTQLITAALSASRKRIAKTEIGKGTVIATLGLDAANNLLDTIDSTEAFRHVKHLVANGWLDVGNPLVRMMIDQLCSPEDAARLKSLAEVDYPVSEYEVRCLCWSDAGEWIV